MKNTKHIKLNVLIPTYNNCNNLEVMLKSLFMQKRESFGDIKIVIHLDACTDGSELMVRKLLTKFPIRILKSTKRIGFALGIKKMIEAYKADIYLILNDDIFIKGSNLFKRILHDFVIDKNLQMLCGNPKPYRCTSFVEKAILSSYNAFNKIRYEINNGHNKYTVDGKVLALRSEFVKSLAYTRDIREMGNFDIYLYFHAIKNHMEYKHDKNAVVFYKFPNNIKDYINWTTRNNANVYLLKKNYDNNLVEYEHLLPKKIYIYKIIEALKNPLGAIFIYTLSFYIQFKSRRWSEWFKPVWPVVKSSKNAMI